MSTDLLSWTELEVALTATDKEHVFSGSAIADVQNRSGFGVDGQIPLVVMYTGHDTATGIQTQSLAWSIDRGRTWTRHVGNPVLDIGSRDFRDPKMFRCGERWIMVLALAEERRVQFYGSLDLVTWEWLSDAGPFGAVEGVWECPDVIEVPIEGTEETASVLLLSVQSGGPAGGSSMQYVVGHFGGDHFVPTTPARWFDHGADCYAAVSYADAPASEAIVQGWMSNWDYAAAVPAHGFRGSMTLPRRLTLRPRADELRLVQRPVATELPLTPLLDTKRVEGRIILPFDLSAARIVVEFDGGTAERVGLDVRLGGDEFTRISVDLASTTVRLDRTHSGTSELPDGFATVHSAPLPDWAREQQRVRLDVYVDIASVEVFAADGEVVLTDQIFPSPGSTNIAVFAEGGTAGTTTLAVSPL